MHTRDEKLYEMSYRIQYKISVEKSERKKYLCARMQAVTYNTAMDLKEGRENEQRIHLAQAEPPSMGSGPGGIFYPPKRRTGR